MTYFSYLNLCSLFVIVQQLEDLRKDLRVTRRAAYASGTHKNHRSQWRAYMSFCIYFDLVPLPASVDTVCLYSQFLSSSLTPNSVRNYLSGVKFLHLVLGHEFPPSSSFDVRVTLRGIERAAAHVPLRAPPVTPYILTRIVSGYNVDPNSVVFSCAFLFSFFLLARISNIVPPSVRAFCAAKHLCREDIIVDGSGLLVIFKWSKTRPLGSGHLRLPLVPISGSILCPVQMFKRMAELFPVTARSPAFVYRSAVDGSLCTITKSLFVSVFRQRLRANGVSDPHLFRGHSFRRGGAHYAFDLGVPGELIQVFGDWKSDAYKAYLNLDIPAKRQLALAVAHSLS